jgi:MFS family permease
VGLLFSLAGLVSAVSVLVIAPRFFATGRMAKGFATAFVFAAAGHLLLGFAGTAAVYFVGFLVIGMVMSAMTPTASTLIAANASRARRGTAFGIASSFQALALAIGPIGAAVFAAVSLEAGFILLAVVILAIAVLVRLTLREPSLTNV